VRTVAFHSFLTSSTKIDEIIGSRGSCEATKGISEDEFVGLHKVKVYLLVVVLRLDFVRALIGFYMQVSSLRFTTIALFHFWLNFLFPFHAWSFYCTLHLEGLKTIYLALVYAETCRF
jgi:hypothetical protein